MTKSSENGKTYEDILSHIGDMGFYQKRMLFLTLLACLGEGLHLINTIFTMGAPDFRCAVPGLLNDTYEIQSEAHRRLVNGTIPFDADKGRYSQCYHYKTGVNQSAALPEDGLSSNVTSAKKRKCSRWVYSTDVFASSIVSELDLVCDRDIYISHANMMGMVGLMLGSLISGSLSDLIGRKKSFLLFYWIHMIVAFAAVFATTIPTFLITRVIVTGSGIAFYMSIYVLCTEMVAPRKRVQAGISTQFGWVTGMLVLLLLAYLFRYWKTLQIALACPLIPVAISYIWLIPESPRWLLNKGRNLEAQTILSEMARVNKKELPEKLLLHDRCEKTTGEKDSEEYREEGDTDVEEDDGQQRNKASRAKGLLLLFKSPTLAVRLAILSFGWAVNSMVYYGVTLNMGSIIEGDIYTNFLIMALLELLSYILIPIALKFAGRKTINCACVLLGGGACLATILPLVLDLKQAWVNTVLSNLGKFGITAAFGVIWLYTSELLPTPARQSGIGFCSFIGRVGGIISPYIATLHNVVDSRVGEALPLVVFGASAIAAGLLSLLLPETAKRKLPESVEEAEKMKR